MDRAAISAEAFADRLQFDFLAQPTKNARWKKLSMIAPPLKAGLSLRCISVNHGRNYSLLDEIATDVTELARPDCRMSRSAKLETQPMLSPRLDCCLIVSWYPAPAAIFKEMTHGRNERSSECSRDPVQKTFRWSAGRRNPPGSPTEHFRVQGRSNICA